VHSGIPPEDEETLHLCYVRPLNTHSESTSTGLDSRLPPSRIDHVRQLFPVGALVARLATHYFFIRALMALRAAGDILERRLRPLLVLAGEESGGLGAS
jgi:hypothetical protein